LRARVPVRIEDRIIVDPRRRIRHDAAEVLDHPALEVDQRAHDIECQDFEFLQSH